MTEIVGMRYLIFDIFPNSTDDCASIDAHFGDSAETWIIGHIMNGGNRINRREEAAQCLRLSYYYD
jgi:hypothetical protein